MKNDIYNPSKYLVAKKLYRSGSYRAAFNEIEKYLLEYPYDNTAQLLKARLLYIFGKNDEAKKLIYSLVDIEPNSNPQRYSYELLLEIAIAEDNIDEVKRICNEGINLFSDKGYKFKIALSRLYLSDEDYDKALEVLATSKFNNMELNVARAIVYIKMNDFSSALVELDREENLDYEDDNNFLPKRKPYVDYLKSILLHKLGRNQEALILANNALKETSSYKSKYFDMAINLARLVYINGDHSKAIQICKSIIEKCKNEQILCSVYSFLQYSYIQSGNTKALEDLMEQCNIEYVKNVMHVQLLYSQGKFEESLAIINGMENRLYTIFYRLLIAFRFNLKDEFQKLYEEFINDSSYDPFDDISFEIERARFYILNDNKKERLSYVEKQYLNYSREVAINHIKRRHIDDSLKMNFSTDTNAEELFEYVESKLDSSVKLCEDSNDKYFVLADGKFCDKDNYKFKYIEVICFAGTKKIITMYPNYFYEPNIEINISETKQKRLSQIDKFNRKYGSK